MAGISTGVVYFSLLSSAALLGDALSLVGSVSTSGLFVWEPVSVSFVLPYFICKLRSRCINDKQYVKSNRYDEVTGPVKLSLRNPFTPNPYQMVLKRANFMIINDISL
jgi:hypothetical protein